MNNVAVSLIRTWVPIGVGALISWLITLGIEVDEETQKGLVIACTALIMAIYYGVVKLLERKFPWVGVLLGIRAQPAYIETKTQADVAQVPTEVLPAEEVKT